MEFAKKKKQKTFTIPKFKSKSIEEIIDSVVKSHNPASALGKIKRTKIFIASKLEGSSTHEARALANIPPGTSAKQILDNAVAKNILETLLEQKFSDPRLVERLEEMWNATDKTYNMQGEVIGEREDKVMRLAAFDRVIKLRKYDKSKEDDGKAPAIQQIVFNVLPLPTRPEPIDVEESKSA